MLARLREDLVQLRSDMVELMTATINAGSEALENPADAYVLSGERKLLDVSDLSSDMGRMRELFRLFEQKSGLLQLMDLSSRAEGVQIFIGGESGITPLDECSVITARQDREGGAMTA